MDWKLNIRITAAVFVLNSVLSATDGARCRRPDGVALRILRQEGRQQEEVEGLQ